MIGDFSNLLSTASVLLTLITIIIMLIIIFDPFRRNFSIVDIEFSNYTGLALHGEFERIAGLYSTYIYLQAYNAFFMIMKVLLIFGLSGELSVVLDLISDAAMDFIFFILMFVLVTYFGSLLLIHVLN